MNWRMTSRRCGMAIRRGQPALMKESGDIPIHHLINSFSRRDSTGTSRLSRSIQCVWRFANLGACGYLRAPDRRANVTHVTAAALGRSCIVRASVIANSRDWSGLVSTSLDMRRQGLRPPLGGKARGKRAAGAYLEKFDRPEPSRHRGYLAIAQVWRIRNPLVDIDWSVAVMAAHIDGVS